MHGLFLCIWPNGTDLRPSLDAAQRSFALQKTLSLWPMEGEAVPSRGFKSVPFASGLAFVFQQVAFLQIVCLMRAFRRRLEAIVDFRDVVTHRRSSAFVPIKSVGYVVRLRVSE